MTFNLHVMTPHRTVWNSKAQEVILSTNSGQIGILPDHAPLLSGLDIGVMKVLINNQWTAIALMGGFMIIDNNEMTILVNEAEKATDIDPQEAQEAFELAQNNFAEANGRKNSIEANLALKRAKTRLEAKRES